MKNDDVLEALESMWVMTKETHMIVIGSQSLHGKYPDEADQILRSFEVDIMLQNKSHAAKWIFEHVGRNTQFHADHEYYIDHVIQRDGFPVLADGWKQRVIRKTDMPECRVDYLAPEDLAIAKLGAGRDKDFIFVVGMLQNNFVTIGDIQILVPLVPPQSRQKVEASLSVLLAMLQPPPKP